MSNVSLSWSEPVLDTDGNAFDPDDLVSYEISEFDAGTGLYTVLATLTRSAGVPIVSHVLSGVASGTHVYAIRANASAGSSNWGHFASVLVTSGIPQAPQNRSASAS